MTRTWCPGCTIDTILQDFFVIFWRNSVCHAFFSESNFFEDLAKDPKSFFKRNIISWVKREKEKEDVISWACFDNFQLIFYFRSGIRISYDFNSLILRSIYVETRIITWKYNGCVILLILLNFGMQNIV